MKIICLGSLNIDRVYGVEDFVREGATISAVSYREFAGGKGMNQSVALGRAGAEAYHLGCIGSDGSWLKPILEQAGVNTAGLRTVEGSTGHAVIQVNPQGKNCIIVAAGTNGKVTEDMVIQELAPFGAEDLLLMQNETACVPFAMKAAKDRGMRVAFNPSPVTADLFSYPLQLVDYLILNEVEGELLTGVSAEVQPEQLLNALAEQYPNATVVLTLGSAGVMAAKGQQRWAHQAYPVVPVDTTGAGDTFCGYFLAALAKGLSMEPALATASRAAAIAITKQGAVPSIPDWQQVNDQKTW
ncbi:MAG: ribokinase [Oscillospiraceae bacterium]|nr:ribokinase [Oscillospiraceae bacterium]